MSEQVKLEDIITLPEIQIRVNISSKTIEEYAANMGEGVKYAPIDLFKNDQERLILADGAHRLMAAQNRGLKSIEAEIHECPPAEAISRALEMSLTKNGAHGLRLTPADKRRAVKLALEDKRIRKLGDRAISRMTGVSPQLVADVRKGGAEREVEVESHKRSKPSAPAPAREIVEDSDPTDERVRTLKEWVASGKISWPDIASIFTNDKRVALLVFRQAKFQVVLPAKVGKEVEFVDIELQHRGVDQLLRVTTKG